MKKFRADLKKYAGITGVPDYGAYTGYIACDMAITGIELAGKNPTQKGFIDGLHKLGTYKAADLTCAPVDISLENFGKTPSESCQYFITFKNGKFVVMNKGKPIIGKIVGDPELIAANKRGAAHPTSRPRRRRRRRPTRFSGGDFGYLSHFATRGAHHGHRSQSRWHADRPRRARTGARRRCRHRRRGRGHRARHPGHPPR